MRQLGVQAWTLSAHLDAFAGDHCLAVAGRVIVQVVSAVNLRLTLDVVALAAQCRVDPS